MRYLRAGGIILSLAVLLCGMALRMNGMTDAAMLTALCAMMICYLEKPSERATLIACAVCFCTAAYALLGVQADDPFILIPGRVGEQIVPAGESARRTLGACMYALVAGSWMGETLAEGLLGRGAFGRGAGWSGAPVRICAVFCMLTGAAFCLVPALGEQLVLPPAVLTVASLFTPLATGGVACYIASARSKMAASLMLVVYMACAVFDPALFARHAFFAAVFSVLLTAKAESRRGLLYLFPVALSIGLAWAYRVEGSALSMYAQRLWQSLWEYVQPGKMDWTLRIYARFGVPGFAAVGFVCGAFLFLLGRLLRDSFLYSAPAMAALGWGCMVLLKGVENAPAIADYVFFFVPYGVCLIVGCMRRAPSKKRRNSSGAARP